MKTAYYVEREVSNVAGEMWCSPVEAKYELGSMHPVYDTPEAAWAAARPLVKPEWTLHLTARQALDAGELADFGFKVCYPGHHCHGLTVAEVLEAEMFHHCLRDARGRWWLRLATGDRMIVVPSARFERAEHVAIREMAVAGIAEHLGVGGCITFAAEVAANEQRIPEELVNSHAEVLTDIVL